MNGFWIFATVSVFLGGMALWGIVDSWLKYRERRLKLEAKMSATNKQELEARIRALETIVTDTGLETAAQIEALRDRRAIKSGEKAE